MEHLRMLWIPVLGALLVMAGCMDSNMSPNAGDDDDGWGDDDMVDDDDDAADDDASDDDDDDTVADDDDDDDTTEEPDVCDDYPTEPTTLYMSADDSNSMAGPAWARQMIHDHDKIHGGMRPYEFLNYYDFHFTPADEGHVDIVPQASSGEDGRFNMLVGVVSPGVQVLGRRPRSLTFSVDCSGSMSGHPLNMAKAAMTEIAGNLVEGDIVSVFCWNNSVDSLIELHEVSGPNDGALMAAINQLNSDGSTDLNKGLTQAFDLAQAAYDPERLNRVILISDGDANVGQTHKDLIAEHAADAEGEGIYLVGIGTDGDPGGYKDTMMDAITDAGKGAYIFLDTAVEAGNVFGDDFRFVSVMEVAAREVQLSVTMPAGYVLEEFHGEEVSEDPTEVEPQHLAPNDAMLYHFVLVDCTPEDHDGSEVFEFTVTWTDPITREEQVDFVSMTMDEIIAAAGDQLTKSDAVVAYSQALQDVWKLPAGEREAYIDAVISQVQTAYFETGDADLDEIADLLIEYKSLI